MSNFMIFDKETGQKIAKGMGLVLPSDQPNEMDYLNLREKMQVPELSFKVKMSKRRLRKIHQMAIGKKPRLPRKLKKAARHAYLQRYACQPRWAQQRFICWQRIGARQKSATTPGKYIK